ncbi:MAG TPA: beta-L-arabinofuranosidase domain-containing protein [Armatimonadota bacterium]|jgi:hypothetical protein
MTIITRSVSLVFVAALAMSASAQQNPTGLARPNTARAADVFTPLPAGAVRLTGGLLGDRYAANVQGRLLKVDEQDLLDAFEHRLQPHQDWAGEHVGKFLHAATLTWATTHNAALKAKIDRVARRLIATQEPDGYLGTYAPDHRWTSWDVWVHKYDILGLLTYYQYTHNPSALTACRRAGDLLLNTFGPGKRDINKAGEHMGMASDSVLEPMALLYRATADKRYLAFAQYIVKNYDAPGGPRILSTLDTGVGVDKVANNKAYEMLSNFVGLLELNRIQPSARIRHDVLHAWSDVRANRLYITGSASAGEHFGDARILPTGEGAHICEVCVTVTWEQMNLQLLRLLGDSRCADEIERTVYNHLLAAQKPSGEAWSYYTPLEGRKPFSPATTCCLSSGPRGVALIPSAAVMASQDGGLVVNLFNPLTATAALKSGAVTLTQTSDYPSGGNVTISVAPAAAGQRFPLRVRIPAWAPRAILTVNGRSIRAVPGRYAVISRAWRRGDRVRLTLPMKVRFANGDHNTADMRAAMYGPMVLALDQANNPRVRLLKQVALETVQARPVAGHALVFRAAGYIGGQADAVPLTLVPYAMAGASGSRLAVWMARPGFQMMTSGSGSLLFGGKVVASRRGNSEGDIADDDPTTYSVTWDATKAAEDWYEVSADRPITVSRVVFMHGRNFNNGGWWDTSSGKPRIEVRDTPGGPWRQVGTLDSYPDTTATQMPDLKDGQAFSASFPPTQAVAVRVIGIPSCGDGPDQSFTSCAELQAF